MLTIGVAADSNIVIFERIKEEVRAGRSMSSAIAAGYKRGIATIIDANVVTLLTAFILFVLATAGRQGLRLHPRRRHDRLAADRGRLHPGAARQHEPLAPAALAERARRRRRGHALALRLHGRQPLVLLDLRRDPAGRRAWRWRPSSSTSASTSSRAPGSRRRWKSRPTRKACAKRSTRSGISGEEIQQVTDPNFGDNVFQIQSHELEPGRSAERREQALGAEFGVAENGFDSTSVGPTFGAAGGQQRPQGADLLAAGDLRLRRAALRPEVRGAGADRDLPRHPDHRRRLLVDRKRGEQRDGRRLPDHLGLLDLRHDHRLRPNTRERAADAAGRLLADRQPLDERGADPVAGDQLLDPARRSPRCWSSAARPCRTSPSRCWSGSPPAPTRRSSSPRRC